MDCTRSLRSPGDRTSFRNSLASISSERERMITSQNLHRYLTLPLVPLPIPPNIIVVRPKERPYQPMKATILFPYRLWREFLEVPHRKAFPSMVSIFMSISHHGERVILTRTALLSESRSRPSRVYIGSLHRATLARRTLGY